LLAYSDVWRFRDREMAELQAIVIRRKGWIPINRWPC
jgi:hypothetical protein